MPQNNMQRTGFIGDVKKIPDYDWLNEIFSVFCSLEMGDETEVLKRLTKFPLITQIRTYQISRLQ